MARVTLRNLLPVGIAVCTVLVFSLVILCWSQSPTSVVTNYSLNRYAPADCKSNASRRHVHDPKKILFVFTGRWQFLRVGLPYIYRDLRKNGGVLDKVFFMMLNYDHKTQEKLKHFTTTSNKLLGEEVFELHYTGFKPGQTGVTTGLIYYELFADLINNPYNQYVKADDDIVYYHQDAFRSIFEKKNSSQCFMHFGNIAGTNWRCSITHQRMGLYENTETNPKHLKFDYDPRANCGWKSLECAELTLRTFLHYYKKQQISKYLFRGLEPLTGRKRFSINFHLFDKDLIRVKEMMEVGEIGKAGDEVWWTVKYSPKPSIKQPNCIVGEALVVHFSYFTTCERLLELGYLKEFEKIVRQEVGAKVPQLVWSALGYSV